MNTVPGPLTPPSGDHGSGLSGRLEFIMELAFDALSYSFDLDPPLVTPETQVGNMMGEANQQKVESYVEDLEARRIQDQIMYHKLVYDVKPDQDV